MFGNTGTVYGAWASPPSQFLHVRRRKSSQVPHFRVFAWTVSKCTWTYLRKGIGYTIVVGRDTEVVIRNIDQFIEGALQGQDYWTVSIGCGCETHREMDASLLADVTSLKRADSVISGKTSACPDLNLEDRHEGPADLPYIRSEDPHAHIRPRSNPNPKLADPQGGPAQCLPLEQPRQWGHTCVCLPDSLPASPFWNAACGNGESWLMQIRLLR